MYANKPVPASVRWIDFRSVKFHISSAGNRHLIPTLALYTHAALNLYKQMLNKDDPNYKTSTAGLFQFLEVLSD